MGAFPEFGPKARTYKMTADGVTMRVVVEGTGPDVIFVPSGDSTAESYAQQFARLSDSFRCLSYDPRGVPYRRGLLGAWPTMPAIAPP